jgi:hypothetical protein
LGLEIAVLGLESVLNSVWEFLILATFQQKLFPLPKPRIPDPNILSATTGDPRTTQQQASRGLFHYRQRRPRPDPDFLQQISLRQLLLKAHPTTPDPTNPNPPTLLQPATAYYLPTNSHKPNPPSPSPSPDPNPNPSP